MICGMILTILEAGAEKSFSACTIESGLFLVRMAAVTALFFPLFLFRMLGAGDIKLAALICGYAGFTDGAAAVGLGLLIGAVWSFLKMMVNGSLFKRLYHLTVYIGQIYHTKKITAYYDPARDGTEAVIPLAVCLFLGTALTVVIPG